VTARLHVFLGAGGVGKTTLAAGYALALARAPGRRVGLLGIDPSRRLKDALHLALSDAGAAVPDAGTLRAAVLDPAESVRRWAAEACPDLAAREALLRNPFFVALADRLATATDIFAAARVAEWAEQDPGLTDLVVDTAPGQNAIEFLTRPERVAAFLGGRLVGWLRRLAPGAAAGPGRLQGGALRLAGGLVRLGGSHLLTDLATFFWLVDGLLSRMGSRVEVTRRWLRGGDARLLVVTSVRHDGAERATDLTSALARAGLAPHAVVVNRAVGEAVAGHVQALERTLGSHPEGAPVVRYALAYAGLQARVARAVQALAPVTVLVADARGLDGDARLQALTEVGERLRAGLG
jgi:hypothetical protein